MQRTYRVTFPDGTFAERSTKSMLYRFAICDHLPERAAYRLKNNPQVEVEGRPAQWVALSWSQSTTPAVNAQRQAIKHGHPRAKILHVELVKGAEVEWKRDEARGVMECIVTATTNPKKWPVGSILNTLALQVSA